MVISIQERQDSVISGNDHVNIKRSSATKCLIMPMHKSYSKCYSTKSKTTPPNIPDNSILRGLKQIPTPQHQSILSTAKQLYTFIARQNNIKLAPTYSPRLGATTTNTSYIFAHSQTSPQNYHVYKGNTRSEIKLHAPKQSQSWITQASSIVSDNHHTIRPTLRRTHKARGNTSFTGHCPSHDSTKDFRQFLTKVLDHRQSKTLPRP